MLGTRDLAKEIEAIVAGDVETWYKLEVTWKNGDHPTIVEFKDIPHSDYAYAYDHYSLCVAAAQHPIAPTGSPAMAIALYKVTKVKRMSETITQLLEWEAIK